MRSVGGGVAATVTERAGSQQVTAAQPPVEHDRVLRIVTLLAPALVYLVVRQVGLLVLAWMASHNGVAVTSALASWDGEWFIALAAGGYDSPLPGLTDAFGRHGPETPLAFFPGYPALVAAVGWLPGVEPPAAAFAASLVAGVVCAYGLARLVRALPAGSPQLRDRAGLVLVALFAASPMGVVLSMAYSEALFCALAVWALVGVIERRWLLAGLCTAAAGLVRPTAAALVVAVGLAALVAVLGQLSGGGPRQGWRPWVAGLLAPAGLVGYLGFVASRTGRWDGWFALQRDGWDSYFDGGAATLGFTVDVLATAPSLLEVVTVAVLAGAVVPLAVAARSWRRSVAWPLLVYATLVLAMDLGSNGLMNSKARLLLPAFVLLIPPAIGLARRRPGTVFAVLGAATLASAWFGAYSLTVWPYAI
ncbi:MAG: DUF2029 domain-containing protein [Pseudonocardiaceae bacterium]|nr:DUF2029 domain-containing protein [Pseudonocardiaceae bacterium]